MANKFVTYTVNDHFIPDGDELIVMLTPASFVPYAFYDATGRFYYAVDLPTIGINHSDGAATNAHIKAAVGPVEALAIAFPSTIGNVISLQGIVGLTLVDVVGMVVISPDPSDQVIQGLITAVDTVGSAVNSAASVLDDLVIDSNSQTESIIDAVAQVSGKDSDHF